MKPHDALPRELIVRVAVIGEALLLIFGIIWARLWGLHISFSAEVPAVTFSVALALLLYLLNTLLLDRFSIDPHSIYRRFKEEVLFPLAWNLRAQDIVLIALFSGVAEEFFFRGVLDPFLMGYVGTYMGISISSFIFAYVHFIGMVKQYGRLIPIYFLIGLIFSLMTMSANSIVPAMVTHVLYNGLALTHLRAQACSREVP